jgi:hypothetical protein
MTINVTAQLQVDIKTIMDTFNLMRNEALDLYNLYWKGGVNGDITAAAGTDPVTQTTRLTKTQLINGLTFAENINNFFDNIAVTTGDYLATCETNIHGNATATLISTATEAFGDRSVQFCADAITQYNLSRDAENWYNSSELSAMIGSISTQTIVYGSNMTKDDLIAAIVLLQQYQNALENSAVTTGDYKVTVGKWLRL